MPISVIAPLVGAHFRPPAKSLLAILGVKTPLQIIRERENSSDADAVGVWLETSQLERLSPQAKAQLESDLSGYGFDLSGLLETPTLQLGYIGAKSGHAKMIASFLDKGQLVEGTLTFSLDGSPSVDLLIYNSAEQPLQAK